MTGSPSANIPANRYKNVRLIQFARAPVPGKVKTRLVPALGEQGACELHLQLVEHQLRRLVDCHLATVELWTDDVAHAAVQQWSQHYKVALHAQSGDNLGQRMHCALARCTGDGNFAVLVGSDCPAIDGDYLQQAIEALNDGADVVLGPASDGGYVLLAVKQSHAGLFADVQWGSANVLQQTLNNIYALGWACYLLDELPDIDRPADLELLASYGLERPGT